MTEIASF